MSTSGRDRPLRGASRAQMKSAEANIDQANRVSDDDFVREYLQPSENWAQWTHPKTGDRYTIGLKRAGNLSETEMVACFELLEETSGPDYKASVGGWHPLAKTQEMHSPDLRYILVKAEGAKDDGGSIQAFASLMPTFEDQRPVIYCYEMQLRASVQRAGLGRRLMDHVVSAAANTPSVEKTMLTCFVRNEGARRFYERMGFEMDESSPRDRKLRNGRLVTSDYVILSCRIRGTRRRSTEEG